MTWALLLDAILKYGPQVLPLAQKIIANIEAGHGQTTVSSADIDELLRLSKQTAGDILAREGIALPAAGTPAPAS